MKNEKTPSTASDAAQRWREYDKKFAEAFRALPFGDQMKILYVAERDQKRMPGTYRRICESLKAG